MGRDIGREVEVDARLRGCGRVAGVMVALLGVALVALITRIALG